MLDQELITEAGQCPQTSSRIAGYSQMFKLTRRDLQDHIIARTEHRR